MLLGRGLGWGFSPHPGAASSRALASACPTLPLGWQPPATYCSGAERQLFKQSQEERGRRVPALGRTLLILKEKSPPPLGAEQGPDRPGAVGV